jgi:hypothetical protein
LNRRLDEDNRSRSTVAKCSKNIGTCKCLHIEWNGKPFLFHVTHPVQFWSVSTVLQSILAVQALLVM